ncbi:MAG: GNAT family N-acetyltransferase [Methanocorpusculum sp.]|nr:GNAT family N-acetyltransferase [Methanocorpusculum sp.]
MFIETERLRIEPLGFDEFAQLDGVDSNTREAMNGLYSSRPNGSDFFWYSYWKISLKSDREHVGGFCFMSEPSPTGAVEIGYGIDEKYQGHGFMTEALSAIADFAKGRGVKIMTAETEKDNSASQSVLKKCGFVLDKENNGNILLFCKIIN